MKKITTREKLYLLDESLIRLARMSFVPLARLALFVIFFWFGLIKVIGGSPAEGLAEAMTAKTIGADYFGAMFMATGILECLIGVLFLIPRLTRVAIPLLFFHMFVVAGPIVLVPEMTWQSFMVPTLEGQYIVKNFALVALAIGVAAYLKPLKPKKR